MKFWVNGKRTDYEPQTEQDHAIYGELRVVGAQTDFTGYEMQLIEERLRLVYRQALKNVRRIIE